MSVLGVSGGRMVPIGIDADGRVLSRLEAADGGSVDLGGGRRIVPIEIDADGTLRTRAEAEARRAAGGWSDGVDTVLPGSTSAVARTAPPPDPAARDRQVRALHSAVDDEIALLAAEARALRGRIADVVARSTAPDGATTRHVYQERQVAVEARRAEAAARALVLRLGEWTTARDRGAR